MKHLVKRKLAKSCWLNSEKCKREMGIGRRDLDPAIHRYVVNDSHLSIRKTASCLSKFLYSLLKLGSHPLRSIPNSILSEARKPLEDLSPDLVEGYHNAPARIPARLVLRGENARGPGAGSQRRRISPENGYGHNRIKLA